MVIRIRQVGKGLDPATQARVGRRLRGRSTWVLGYSGKDEDIMRALGTAQPASIHWLTHGGHDPPLAELSRAVSCHIFRGDLRALARSLRARLKIPSGQPQVTSRSAPRSRPLSRPASKTGEQLACLARVAREARQHRLASEICEAAIPHVTPPNGISWFAVEASTALWMLGDKSDAFAWLDRAANAREEPRLVWRAAIENMRGLVLLDPPAPKPTAARRSFVNAFRANERYLADRRAMWWSRVDAFQARVENNWGLALHALGRYDEAIRLFHRSLRRKRRYGDLLGRSQTAANLAVTYFKIENMRRHRIWRREATSLADRFDLTYQHGEMLREIAELLLARGERTGALAHLEEARDLLESEDRDLALRRRVDGLLARI